MAFASRVYQLNAKSACLETFEAGVQSTLMVLPTGTGKTFLSAMIAEEFHAMTGKRTLFLAHRNTLINQAEDKFTRYGLDVAVEMAAQDAVASEALFGKSQVVVGSVPTMQGPRLSRFDRDEFGLLIVDETHHITAKSHRAIVEHFGEAYLLGITATPKPSLGEFFKTVCFTYPIHTALYGDGGEDEGGWLVPPKILKCPVSVDLRGLKTTGGDYNTGDLEERLFLSMNEIADAVHQNCENRQTVIFTPDCGSAQALSLLIREKYGHLGRTCEYVAGTGGKFGMPRKDRDAILKRFESGEFQILVNCELLFEGWDCETVKCVVLCRPCTKEMRYRFVQMVGRGLRPAPQTGYFNCLVLDLDWQTDRDGWLTSSVDLYAEDRYSDEVMDEARKIEQREKAGGDETTEIKPEEILEEAEEIVRVRNKLQIKVNHDIKVCKPIDSTPKSISKMIDVKFKTKYDMDSRGDNPATQAQVYRLKELGIDRPDGISKWGAIKMISALVKRIDKGLATIPQVKSLVEKGVDPLIARNMSGSSASQSLSELGKMEAAAKRVQGSFF